MDCEKGWDNSGLERYRSYLSVLARAHLNGDLKPRLDPSDLVQETLTEAYVDRQALGNVSDERLLAWLRRILSNNVVNALRDHRREKRDIRRERSLDAAMDDSCARLEKWLDANVPTPSSEYRRGEFAVRLADALEALPPLQREAVILRHLRGEKVIEIARQLGRNPGAVAGLIHRGLKSLREALGDGG